MEALQKFERLALLLSHDMHNASLRLDCVAAALEAKNYDVALLLVDDGLRVTPSDSSLLFSRANVNIGQRAYQEALNILSRLQALHPSDPAIEQNIALCHYCMEAYADALTCLEPLYEAGIRSNDVIRLLVSTYHHLGFLSKAVPIADANRALASEDSATAGVYALVYLDNNQAADAARCAAQSLRKNPKCIDALTVDATLQLARGAVADAKTKFDQILSLNPHVGRAWIGLGSIAMLRRDFAQAKSDLKRGLEFMPTHVGSWHLLGWTHLVAGELDEAEQQFVHALELNRNFAETHGALASIAAMRDRQQEAQEMIKVALRLDPACLSARFAQSVLAAKNNDMARSQQIIAEGLRTLAGTTDAGVLRRLLTTQTEKRPTK